MIQGIQMFNKTKDMLTEKTNQLPDTKRLCKCMEFNIWEERYSVTVSFVYINQFPCHL